MRRGKKDLRHFRKSTAFLRIIIVNIEPTIENTGTFNNGCTRWTVTWTESGATKKRHFRKSYSAQYFAKQCAAKAAAAKPGHYIETMPFRPGPTCELCGQQHWVDAPCRSAIR